MNFLIKTPMILRSHNFMCKLSIVMTLQISLKERTGIRMGIRMKRGKKTTG
jgi:hypothetical protein